MKRNKNTNKIFICSLIKKERIIVQFVYEFHNTLGQKYLKSTSMMVRIVLTFNEHLLVSKNIKIKLNSNFKKY
ncbi:hypothetical protein BpHYR1_045399 [Brachionus plicatilis]|uniref:Uncharacterized protein n=1 Tax=Brachionus plicatilis TaxID=10195 RepID=A0A3M7SLN4_BRAPC|nr:hypothetical protein BpHYR1_045399 [Brachionus plicatilis]